MNTFKVGGSYKSENGICTITITKRTDKTVTYTRNERHGMKSYRAWIQHCFDNDEYIVTKDNRTIYA